MTDTSEDWRALLARWSQEWADARDQDPQEEERPARDEEPLRTRWLGFPTGAERAPEISGQARPLLGRR
ncbi:hypothetical protein ABZ357_16585 [Streptomyces sp. NPDC005917]|uniref:hypothetical protein n=1 Tax=unclassified Streptomyces TaxID=2593676 RepID=UPI0033C2953E